MDGASPRIASDYGDVGVFGRAVQEERVGQVGAESGFGGVRDGHCGCEGPACGAACAAQEGELGGGFEGAEGVEEWG